MDRALPEKPAGLVVPTPRRNWTVPTLRELPKLTQLTLASAIGGGGGTGGGGSTVFGLLLAVGLLCGIGACADESPTTPSGSSVSAPVSQLVTCRGDVEHGT